MAVACSHLIQQPGRHCARRPSSGRIAVSEPPPVLKERYHDGQNETVLSFASYDGTEIRYRILGDGAPLFNDATVVVQPGAAHFPWIDGPAAFAAAVGSFLSQPPVRT